MLRNGNGRGKPILLRADIKRLAGLGSCRSPGGRDASKVVMRDNDGIEAVCTHAVMIFMSRASKRRNKEYLVGDSCFGLPARRKIIWRSRENC